MCSLRVCLGRERGWNKRKMTISGIKRNLHGQLFIVIIKWQIEYIYFLNFFLRVSKHWVPLGQGIENWEEKFWESGIQLKFMQWIVNKI